jgi:putative ABC transport system permease protein
MIRQNLKTFIKHLFKNKLYTVVTVVGFSVSLMFVVLLSIYLKNEYSVNDFHVNKDRIYRLRNERTDGFPPPMGQVLQDKYPEIESYTRIFENNNIIDNKSGNSMMFHFLMADSTFFSIFSYPLLQGNPSDALKTKNSIVLTSEFAHKLFGDGPALGKEVMLATRVSCTVTGIVDNIEKNSSFKKIDAIVNFRCLADLWGSSDFMNSYGNSSFGLYLLAKPNTDLPSKAPQMLEQFKKDFWLYQNNRSKEVIVEPLLEVYFSKIGGQGLRQNSITLLMVLMAIVISILGLAIINYMNLTIAQSGLRVKETAIKKLVGSSRRMLIHQYITESVLLCSLSFVLAIILSLAGQTIFNQLFSSQINLADEFNLKVISFSLSAVLGLGILSGIVPALIITRLNAVEVIKGSFRRKSKGVYSKVLIGFQYTVVIVLIMSTLLISKQTNFIQKYDLGFNSKNILKMDFMIDRKQKEGLKDQLMTIPGVKNVSYVMGCPDDGGNNMSFTYHEKPVSFQQFVVDSSFFTMMGIHVQSTGVAYSQNGMWLNRTAVKTLELDPLPKSFKTYGQEIPVLGVIDDFNFQPLYRPVGDLMVGQLSDNAWPWSILVQIDGSNLVNTVDEVKTTYSKFSGGVPFNYAFMDDTIGSWYEKEVRTNKIVGYFTFLTILIAVMGIFAMSVFYLQQKVKEIGIRKVNGAKVSEVISMLNFDFIVWVVIAFIVALPIAWFIMNKWLQNFAYKTEISWWIFALSGTIALGIALLTVSWQSWRAATRNPVEALRYE